MSNNDLEKLTFEKAMKELEELVDSLDKGDVSLDEAIAAYDRGSQLKVYCEKKLLEAKMKFFILLFLQNSRILKNPTKLESTYGKGFLTLYRTPAWAARFTTKCGLK